MNSHSESNDPLFTSESPYGVLEFYNNYKDTHLSLEAELTRIEINHEPTQIRPIENVWIEETDMNMKASPKIFTFRYTLTMNKHLYSQSINLESKQKRNDVALKSSIRTIRKHIKNKFKTRNARLMKRRLWNVKNCEIVKNIKKMISETLSDELWTNDLAKYIIGVCKLKSLNKFKLSDELIEDINLFLNWTKQYSYSTFLKLVNNNLFQNLWKVVDQDMISECLKQELEKSKQ